MNRMEAGHPAELPARPLLAQMTQPGGRFPSKYEALAARTNLGESMRAFVICTVALLLSCATTARSAFGQTSSSEAAFAPRSRGCKCRERFRMFDRNGSRQVQAAHRPRQRGRAEMERTPASTPEETIAVE
jgi:hypothetical protein